MKKENKRYVCNVCGYSSLQFYGRCPNCGEWNSMVEESHEETIKKHVEAKLLSEIKAEKEIRIPTCLSEFDRVLGGGIVNSSITILCGEPGIGKSTLALQIAFLLANSYKVLYISGEESFEQIKLRAQRIKEEKNIYILPQTDMEEIESEINRIKPNFIIVDSIQTMYLPKLDALPGGVTQVRECGMRFMEIAKSNGISIILIGHVTKEGEIAGPKTLEHMVDTVLYLEGEKNYFYRILRATKNRFGPTNEIGIFEMQQDGLKEVKDTSFIFLTKESTPGSVISCVIEGTRPLLVEIQALLAPQVYKMPQRISTGIDYKRLSMLLGVIEARLGIKVSNYDTFINVVGGITLDGRDSDLAIILSVVSSAKNIIIPKEVVAIGEVGLSGELRQVSLIEKRINEIDRLGFKKCILPECGKKIDTKVDLCEVKNIVEAINAII